MVLYQGRHDVDVSWALAAEWLDVLQPPRKRVVWIEQSAHEGMNKEPGKLLVP